MLILLGVPALLGFSERAMPFAEQRSFGGVTRYNRLKRILRIIMPAPVLTIEE
jgi:hypothetical protein